ncbi:unnamed protein product [Protopolystoma xenopodis]|uniref:Uncharacterized protein n=1 Tax=Protopolystoma xenopodis TaxID=117903 RepID=A0A448WBP6_9PLAT|nr:unnamed protein product [Protopolystoma xenopodis]
MTEPSYSKVIKRHGAPVQPIGTGPPDYSHLPTLAQMLRKRGLISACPAKRCREIAVCLAEVSSASLANPSEIVAT